MEGKRTLLENLQNFFLFPLAENGLLQNEPRLEI